MTTAVVGIRIPNHLPSCSISEPSATGPGVMTRVDTALSCQRGPYSGTATKRKTLLRRSLDDDGRFDSHGELLSGHYGTECHMASSAYLRLD